MPKEMIAIEIGASAEAVFDLIHDYDQRLDWDPLLSKACIISGEKRAAKGSSNPLRRYLEKWENRCGDRVY